MTARCAIRRSRACARTRKRPTSCASEPAPVEAPTAKPTPTPRDSQHATTATRDSRARKSRARRRRKTAQARRRRRRRQAVASRQAAISPRRSSPSAISRCTTARSPTGSCRIFADRPLSAGALSRRLEQAVLLPEARRQERQRRGRRASQVPEGERHGDLFRRRFAARRSSRWCSGASSSCIRGARATPKLDRPDRLIFDFDPDDGVAWKRNRRQPSACCARCSTTSGSRAFSRRPAARACTSSCRSGRRSTGTQAKASPRRSPISWSRTFPDRFIATLSEGAAQGQDLHRLPAQRRRRDGDRAVCDPRARQRAGVDADRMGGARHRRALRSLQRPQCARAAARPAQGSMGVDRRDPSNGDTRNVQACSLRGLAR